MIELRAINRDNFDAVIKLSVFDEQKNFVASNLYSLAQAKAYPECIPLAIYYEKDLVGFIMFCLDYEDQEYWVYRLMIDKHHQRKGYGKQAMKAVIERIRKEGRNKLYTSFEKENHGAQRLYTELGFKADGRIIDDEIVCCLNIR